MQNIFSGKIIRAWLVVGTLDITAACLQVYIKFGRGPSTVLMYVASAVFGQDAATDKSMIFWGLLFHYIVALSFTILFFLLAAKFPSLLKQKILNAIVYGAFMWAFMQFAVLPFTKIPHRPVIFFNALIAIRILVVCIGIPLTYFAATKKVNK